MYNIGGRVPVLLEAARANPSIRSCPCRAADSLSSGGRALGVRGRYGGADREVARRRAASDRLVGGHGLSRFREGVAGRSHVRHDAVPMVGGARRPSAKGTGAGALAISMGTLNSADRQVPCVCTAPLGLDESRPGWLVGLAGRRNPFVGKQLQQNLTCLAPLRWPFPCCRAPAHPPCRRVHARSTIKISSFSRAPRICMEARRGAQRQRPLHRSSKTVSAHAQERFLA